MAAVLHLEQSELNKRYRVERHLATGAETELFLAFDPITRQAVVIKAFVAHLCHLSPTVGPARLQLERFRREGRWLDRVGHPNIVRRLASGQARDKSGVTFDYHVLEYLAGGTLAALSQATGGLPPAVALPLLRQVAAALSHCHALGIVHGDVEPSNLLLTDDRQTLKLADFGSAADDETPADGKVVSDLVCVYAPPECLAEGRRAYAAATDVYGLAKTLYAVLSGEPPVAYVGQPIAALPAQMAALPPAEALLGILRRATATQITARYPSLALFWSEVERVLMHPSEATPAVVVQSVETGRDIPGRQTPLQDAPGGQLPADGVARLDATTPEASLPAVTTTRLIGVGVVLMIVLVFVGGLTALYRLTRATVREQIRPRPLPAARPLFKVKLLAPTKAYAAPTESLRSHDWLGDVGAGVEADVLEIRGRFYRIRPQRWVRRKSEIVTDGWILREQADGGL